MHAKPTFDLVDAKDRFADGDWFQICRRNHTPYVVVRSGETSADVLWDYVTLPPTCDSLIQQQFAAFEADVCALFARFANPDSYLRVKPTLIGFDRLSFEHAKQAAAELYALIERYLPASTSVVQSAPAPAAFPAPLRLHGTSERRQGQPAENPRHLWVERSITANVA